MTANEQLPPVALGGRSGRPRRAPKKKTEAEPRSIAGVDVLVVEDDPGSRKLASLVLTDAGAHVTAVTSAEEALLELGKKRLPALVLLDLVLPGLGGLAFVAELKAHPRTREIPVIAVTALNGPETEREALAAGCSLYIRKPIDTQTFADRIARHLGGA